MLNVYIIFYFNAKEIQNIEFIIKEIDDNLNIFIENGISTFILEGTNKVWEIREQSKLVRKVKEEMAYNKRAKKYYAEDLNELAEILAIKFITNNFNKNITLKDVSDEVFLSQNYLSELFKK